MALAVSLNSFVSSMPSTDVHDASEGYASAESNKHSLERSSRGAALLH